MWSVRESVSLWSKPKNIINLSVKCLQELSRVAKSNKESSIDNWLRLTINWARQLTEIDWLNLIASGKPFWLVFWKASLSNLLLYFDLINFKRCSIKVWILQSYTIWDTFWHGKINNIMLLREAFNKKISCLEIFCTFFGKYLKFWGQKWT